MGPGTLGIEPVGDSTVRLACHALREHGLARLGFLRHRTGDAGLLVCEVPERHRAAGEAVLHPGSGLAHFLWYYLSSGRGRAAIASRLTATSVPTLSAKALGEVSVPVPSSRELSRMPDLVHAAESSRETALEAGRVRHDVLRDAIIAEIAARGDG